MLAARIRAGLREGGASLIASSPALALIAPTTTSFDLTCAMWLTIAATFAPVVTLLRAQISGTLAPDHQRYGLTIRGQGCHLCRLLRFWLPLTLAPAAWLAALLTNIPILIPLGVGLAALHLTTGTWAILKGHEPNWTAQTGFQIIHTE